MYLPFSHNIKTSLMGDTCVVAIQLKSTYTPQPHHLERMENGFMLDPYLYLHQTIDLNTGDVIKTYTAPPDF